MSFVSIDNVVEDLLTEAGKLQDAASEEDVIETRIAVCRIEAKCKEIRAELLEIDVPEDVSEED